MLLHSLLTILSFTISLEGCVRMIPPEEVSISSTLATVPTHEPSRPPPEVSTVAPATNEPPVTMSPPVTEAPVTETPTDPCTTCNFAKITSTPPGTGFLRPKGPDGCKQVTVKCKRTDDTKCAEMSISATGASGSVGSIGNAMETTEAEATLICQSDGTYSSVFVDGITELSCISTKCIRLCTTCDISSIAPLMIPPKRNYVAEPEEDSLCLEYFSQCRLNDYTQSCSTIQISAETTAGPVVLSEMTNSFFASATISCGNDGTFYSDTTMGITRLSCSYGSCTDD
ncbi:hypothetical protein GCK72_021478 [Caenorhabditis remanei]|uniref:DUF281 domain-containing protein n=1 Tax=Caenorhabditis remanei TaxID=31234 RepID=A0A6A5GJQ7_CAERE|nr:hypothetical protein GCK72_021478 [Caenorhabditis remanei]KAF1754913.1 hypothetical protein GCK72_021478 [Caenorhabditis remanei]